MAYRVKLNVDDSQLQRLRELSAKAPQVVEPILRDATDLVKQYAVQNLSGVPFTSITGSHIINKGSGQAAAAVQVQMPYGSPFKARLFASKMTRYDGNPETYNYLAILEYGRGEVKPKYTPSMRAGNPDRARLAIPVGPHELVFGQKGFRGVTGRYRFVKSLPAVEGKYWMQSAVESARPEFPGIVNQHLNSLVNPQ